MYLGIEIGGTKLQLGLGPGDGTLASLWRGPVDVAAGGDFPVQNGKAEFTLTGTATFQPDCTPPMTVVFTNVVVCDTEHDVCVKVPGTF